MRNYKILNRPMFNRNNSAYGRGIASNLVSEEERQRFNYGGRVGLEEGGNELTYAPWSDVWSDYIKPGLKTVTDVFKKGLHPSYGDVLGQDAEGEDVIYEDPLADAKKKYAQKKAKEERTAQSKRDFAKARYEMTSDEAMRGTGVSPLRKVDDPAATQVDLDSDQLFTDEEQKEKKSQMALAIAGRLIGGSRDKWGSKAQMENIAGGLGDIRKIVDPSERREMEAKYKAWGKARTKETLANLREQERINSSEEALLNQHIGQPLSFKVSEILKIKNVERNTPFIVTKIPDPNNPGKEKKGRVIDKTKLEVGILYTDPADPNSFMVLDSQGIIQTLSSTTDIIEARDKKLIK